MGHATLPWPGIKRPSPFAPSLGGHPRYGLGDASDTAETSSACCIPSTRLALSAVLSRPACRSCWLLGSDHSDSRASGSRPGCHASVPSCAPLACAPRHRRFVRIRYDDPELRRRKPPASLDVVVELGGVALRRALPSWCAGDRVVLDPEELHRQELVHLVSLVSRVL